MKKAFFVSLGCPKNLTDTEVLMGKLVSSGYQITIKAKESDIIIVNTCAFLKSAREESIRTIKKYAKLGKKIYVAGCLPEYLNSSLGPPLADHSSLSGMIDGTLESIGLFTSHTPRIKATHPWTAYIKISEGCSNHCAYCLIPKLRGRYRARKIPDILAEVKQLALRGVKEIIYIGQDTTAYPNFIKLLKETVKIKGIKWIRIMYANPKNLSDRIIKTIKEEPKIMKYLDLPIQHISDNILMLMNRPRPSGQGIKELLNRLRREKITVRTSLIVGFPGEKAEDFNKLLEFVKFERFEKLGVFEYSRESGTPAANMRGQVPQKVKRFRFNKLMALQNQISRENNQKMIDKIIEIICEGKGIGRACFDAPQIDGSVKFVGNLLPGEIGRMKVTGASAYSLAGTIVAT